jgi:hypothetical protein
MLKKWLLVPLILISSIYGVIILVLFLTGELSTLNSNEVIFVISIVSISPIILLIAIKYWSRWRKAEVTVMRGWLFLKIWGGVNYVELLPRKIKMVNNMTIKVVGDPWRFYSQGWIIRFNSSDDASGIFNQLQRALK